MIHPRFLITTYYEGGPRANIWDASRPTCIGPRGHITITYENNKILITDKEHPENSTRSISVTMLEVGAEIPFIDPLTKETFNIRFSKPRKLSPAYQIHPETQKKFRIVCFYFNATLDYRICSYS
jgi:hypothetical protein